jgi:clorobiocin biosynthesis protein CloN5
VKLEGLTRKSSNVEFNTRRTLCTGEVSPGFPPAEAQGPRADPEEEYVTTAVTEGEILLKITEYVRQSFLDETDGGSELTETTPLLQLGILNSRNTGRLLAYILEEFGVPVPPTRITGKHFADLGSITSLVTELLADQ